MSANSASDLTEPQTAMLDFICLGILSGNVPSIRELGVASDIQSPNGVSCHLRALQKKGRLRRKETTSRGLKIPDGLGLFPIRGNAEKEGLTNGSVRASDSDYLKAVIQAGLGFLNGSVRQRLLFVSDGSLLHLGIRENYLLVLAVRDSYAPDEDLLFRTDVGFGRGNSAPNEALVLGSISAMIRIQPPASG